MTKHILDFQWGYRFEFGLDGKPSFWYKGHGYYCGCEHDDGEVRKVSHLVRLPNDEVVEISGTSAYRTMTFEEFNK